MLIRLSEADCLPEPEADALAGTLLDDRHYARLVREDATVIKPDGTPLLVFRRNALPAAACEAAYRSLRVAARKTDNRGIAAGSIDGDVTRKVAVGAKSKARFRPVKRDGTVSNTDYAGRAVESGVVGYFDRYERFPYCRLTAFNLERPEQFSAAMPFIRAVDAVFARECPDRYAAQRAVIGRTHPDFVIHGTAFTTITVNRNWQTAVHKDAGDYRPGFGVLSVLQAGRYTGGYLVFPRYRVAVDIRSRDVLLADVHEWHGNTPIVGPPGRFERISCVFYYRENMHRCGSAAEELERAKNRKPGQPRYD